MSKASMRTLNKGPRKQSGRNKHKYKSEDIATLPQIRVITYNVNWGYCLAGLGTGMVVKIHNAIEESDADLVCLQETHEGWQTYLERHFSAKYPYRLFKHHLNPDINHQFKEGSSAGGAAFLSKYPIKETFCGIPDVPGSFFPGTMIALRSPVGVVYVLNVHLRPQISNTHKPSLMAVWSTGTIRKAEMKYLITKMSSHRPSIIVGDFNEGHNGDAVRWLKYSKKCFNGTGYRDGLSEYAETAITWKWPLKMGLVLKGAYDHMFYNPSRIRCVGCHVMSQYELVSDHIPVVADFALLLNTASPAQSLATFQSMDPSFTNLHSPSTATYERAHMHTDAYTGIYPEAHMATHTATHTETRDPHVSATKHDYVLNMRDYNPSRNSISRVRSSVSPRASFDREQVDLEDHPMHNDCSATGDDNHNIAEDWKCVESFGGFDEFDKDFEEEDLQRKTLQRLQHRKLQRSVSDSVTCMTYARRLSLVFDNSANMEWGELMNVSSTERNVAHEAPMNPKQHRTVGSRSIKCSHNGEMGRSIHGDAHEDGKLSEKGIDLSMSTGRDGVHVVDEGMSMYRNLGLSASAEYLSESSSMGMGRPIWGGVSDDLSGDAGSIAAAGEMRSVSVDVFYTNHTVDDTDSEPTSYKRRSQNGASSSPRPKTAYTSDTNISSDVFGIHVRRVGEERVNSSSLSQIQSDPVIPTHTSRKVVDESKNFKRRASIPAQVHTYHNENSTSTQIDTPCNIFASEDLFNRANMAGGGYGKEAGMSASGGLNAIINDANASATVQRWMREDLINSPLVSYSGYIGYGGNKGVLTNAKQFEVDQPGDAVTHPKLCTTLNTVKQSQPISLVAKQRRHSHHYIWKDSDGKFSVLPDENINNHSSTQEEYANVVKGMGESTLNMSIEIGENMSVSPRGNGMGDMYMGESLSKSTAMPPSRQSPTRQVKPIESNHKQTHAHKQTQMNAFSTTEKDKEKKEGRRRWLFGNKSKKTKPTYQSHDSVLMLKPLNENKPNTPVREQQTNLQTISQPVSLSRATIPKSQKSHETESSTQMSAMKFKGEGEKCGRINPMKEDPARDEEHNKALRTCSSSDANAGGYIDRIRYEDDCIDQGNEEVKASVMHELASGAIESHHSNDVHEIIGNGSTEILSDDSYVLTFS
eukprot:CFRG4182T1